MFERYFKGIADKNEIIELADLVEESDDRILENLLKKHWNEPGHFFSVFNKSESRRILRQILERSKIKTSKLHVFGNILLRYAATVTMLLTIGVGVYFLFFKQSQIVELATEQIISPENVLPGGNKALLTLADGSILVLDDTETGTIARQANSNILKLSEGQVVYEASGRETPETIYNTITTPRGGQYQLVLPDGTKAYLNAASMVHFPVVFSGSERKVTIEGEVYFEVAQHLSQPFVVFANDVMIKALGTNFNVMSYSDESILETTLLSGSVSVKVSGSQVVIKPGQQARTDSYGKITVVDDFDVDQVLAWKDGWFRFSSNTLEEVMRQISRWYDLDVVYEGELPEKKYTGVVSRNSDLSQVIQMLESAGISFSIINNTITVAY